MTEAWLTGPAAGVDRVLMPAAHALLQSRAEIEQVASDLTPAELAVKPGGAASLSFHLRHIAGAIDRLLSYSRGQQLSPKDLAVRLGITSASMTSLIDRLVRSGHVRREPHPTDRRALVLRPTQGSAAEVRKTLGAMHERMIAAAGALSEDEAATVIGFLEGIRAAVDQIEPAKRA